VDDDPLVLSNVAAMLDDMGHLAITASSGANALKMAEKDLSIDLVISDQAMPGLTGLQLCRELGKSHPNLPFILTSGFAEVSEKIDANIARLPKPYTQQSLARAIAARLAQGAKRSTS
jgi:DNA-binding NtrC family response regulator